MKTALDKANELLEKYRGSITSFLNDRMKNLNAVRCAIICVDEIVDSLSITTGHLCLNQIEDNEVVKDFNYWQDVKKILESKLK